MTKIRILTVSVILLLLLNAGLLFFGFSHSSRPHLHEGPKKVIIDRLHFDSDQVAQYEKSILQHQKAIHEKENEMRQSKARLYALFGKNERSEADSLLHAISAIQKDIEKIHFDHFKAIEVICHENQMADFKALSNDLLELFSSNRPIEK